jgi:hypothetical protein
MKLFCMALLLVGCGTQFSDPIREASRENQGGAGASNSAAGTSNSAAGASNSAAGASNSAAGASNTFTCSGELVEQFDGSTFATAMRLVQDDFTLEVWLKTDQTSPGTESDLGNPIVYADVPATTADDFGAAILGDKFQLMVGNPDTPVRSTSRVTTNEWVHVAASRSRASGIVLVFVNGVLEGVGAANTNELSAWPTMNIGGRAGRDFFVGLMADLRIWATVRSQAQIVDNMHRRLSGNEAGLVGYYRLDDEAGATIRDSSTSQNHATLEAGGARVEANPPLCDQ